MIIKKLDVTTSLELFCRRLFQTNISTRTALIEIAKGVLPDDGTRTYFAYTENQIWISLLEAQKANALYSAIRFAVVSFHPRTEGSGGMIRVVATPPLNVCAVLLNFAQTFVLGRIKRRLSRTTAHLPEMKKDWWIQDAKSCLHSCAIGGIESSKKTSKPESAVSVLESLSMNACATSILVFRILPSVFIPGALSNVPYALFSRDKKFTWQADSMHVTDNENDYDYLVSSESSEESSDDSSDNSSEDDESVPNSVEPPHKAKDSRETRESHEVVPKNMGTIERNDVAAIVSGADEFVSSISCLERMYGEKRKYEARNLVTREGLMHFRTIYQTDPITREFVRDSSGRKIAETKAYPQAKRDAVERECGIFAFDSGVTSDDPKEAAKLQFNKLYFTAGYPILLELFVGGNADLLRFNSETQMYEDVALHRCAYECLMFHRVSKFFTDLEFGIEFNTDIVSRVPQMMENLVGFIIEMARVICNVELEKHDFIVFSSDSAKKISRHLICINPHFYFRTMLAMSWFYLMCANELERRVEMGDACAKSLLVRDKNGTITWFWDFCTIKEFQLFRAPFADKFGAKRILLLHDELNFFSEKKDTNTYADQFARMNRMDQFLNGLIQYPWKGEWPKTRKYVDFNVKNTTVIGRFECVVEEGLLVGFNALGARSRANAAKTKTQTIRTKTFISSGAGDLPADFCDALRRWLNESSFAVYWKGAVLDTARYKFVDRVGSEYSEVMVELKGFGKQGEGAYCYRRALDIRSRTTADTYSMEDDLLSEVERARKRAKIVAPESGTHSNAPVLIYIRRMPDGKWAASQTCNKIDCAKYKHQQLGTCPPVLSKLLNENCNKVKE